jgi:hypothetical protein
MSLLARKQGQFSGALPVGTRAEHRTDNREAVSIFETKAVG